MVSTAQARREGPIGTLKCPLWTLYHSFLMPNTLAMGPRILSSFPSATFSELYNIYKSHLRAHSP